MLYSLVPLQWSNFCHWLTDLLLDLSPPCVPARVPIQSPGTLLMAASQGPLHPRLAARYPGLQLPALTLSFSLHQSTEGLPVFSPAPLQLKCVTRLPLKEEIQT